MVHAPLAWPSEAPTRLAPAAPPPRAETAPPGPRWPLPRPRVLPSPREVRATFEATLAGSMLPTVVGAMPFSRATFAAEANGTYHLCRGSAHLTLREAEARRRLRGVNPRVPVRVQAELIRTSRGWHEVFAEIEEFAHRRDLERDAPPLRRRAVRVHPDGTRVLRSLERSYDPGRDEEVVRRSTRRLDPGGDWEEEEETLLRVAERAKLDHVRRRGPDGGPPRELRAEYPWLVVSAYARAHARISKWAAP